MADGSIRGWKDIASYLKTSERSAQRWERTLRLPVRRTRTDRGSSVSAIPTELDEWQARVAPLESQADDAGQVADLPPAFESVDEGVVHVGRPLSMRWAGTFVVMAAALVILLAIWAGARGGIAGMVGVGARTSDSGRPKTAPPPVLLRVQDSAGQVYRAGIPSGSTGAIQIADRERLLLSPILARDTVSVRIDAVGRDGVSEFVGAIDLKSGARARLNHPFLFEIEWLPTPAAGTGDRH